jgi:hypothetical protein
MQGTVPSQQQQPLVVPPREIHLSLNADGILLLIALAWLAWDRLLKTRVTAKFDSLFESVQDERSLSNILAQVVVLGAFHNGAIDAAGYHLIKLSTINSFTAPGHLPMARPIRDLPVGRIMLEIEGMIAAEQQGDSPWLVTDINEDLPAACRDHLTRNNIALMYCRLVRVGNLPIGILSLQYDPGEERRPPLSQEPQARILEDCFKQVSVIMRRRIVHPSLIKRFWMCFRGGCVSQRNSR